MSDYITNKPFPGSTSKVNQDIYCVKPLNTDLNCNHISNPYCSRQLTTRNAYLRYINTHPPRATIFPGPYPKYTSTQLDIRRKAEILQYNKNANVTTTKRNWSRLASTRRTNSRVCVSRSQVPKSSTVSDVPFPIVDLYYDPSVPLYNYKPNPSTYNEYPYPDTTTSTLQLSILDNVAVPENTSSSPIFTMFYISQPSIAGVYTLTTPMSIVLGGSYYSFLTDTKKATAKITTLTLHVTSVNTDSVEKIIPLSVDSIGELSITFDQSGSFETSFYIGAVVQDDIQLTECPQTNYNFTLRASVNTTQTNADGNTSTDPIIIMPSAVANVTTDSPLFDTQINCNVSTVQPTYQLPSYIINA